MSECEYGSLIGQLETQTERSYDELAALCSRAASVLRQLKDQELYTQSKIRDVDTLRAQLFADSEARKRAELRANRLQLAVEVLSGEVTRLANEGRRS